MKEMRDRIAKLARETITNKFVIYASKTLKWEHLDGQPISLYLEVRNISNWKTTHGTEDEKNLEHGI